MARPADTKTPILHVYRALLRASTYLPDSLARSYVHTHIVQRFRARRRAHPSTSSASALLSEARRSLHRLERAGQGEIAPLVATLQEVYGIKGRHRRQLVQRLRRLEWSGSDRSLGDDNGGRGPAGGRSLAGDIERARAEKRDLSALEQFMKSQRASHTPDAPRKKLTSIHPVLPVENIWGRPLALKRRRGFEKQFWANAFDRLTPPLEEDCWSRLKDLATGVILSEPAQRRRRVGRIQQEIDASKLDATTLTQPARTVAQDRDSIDKHKITQRFMRRIWSLLWSQAAVMVPMENVKGRWNTSWGAGRSSASRGQISSSDRTDLELFEDLDKVSSQSVPATRPWVDIHHDIKA